MPIKELEFSFKIDVETLARILAYGNKGMDIKVYGDEQVAVEPIPNRVPRFSEALLDHLPKHPIVEKRSMMLSVLRARKGNPEFTHTDIRIILVNQGFSRKSTGTCKAALLENKFIRRKSRGKYVVTKKGLAHVA